MVDLYNPHDGLTGRDGGPYLDDVERRSAETIRAAKEGREPDYDNAPAVAGTPLVTAGVLMTMANPASNPSQQAPDTSVDVLDSLVKNKETLLKKFSERDDILDPTEVASDLPMNNPASLAYISKDVNFETGEPVSEQDEKVADAQDETGGDPKAGVDTVTSDTDGLKDPADESQDDTHDNPTLPSFS